MGTRIINLFMDLFILLVLMFILITGLTACSTTTTTYEDYDKKFCNQFVLIEEQHDFDKYVYIVYDIDTKVMYYVYDWGYEGGMLPIYNADGSIKVYDD
jgi:nitrate reductase gamma subunit